MAQACHVGATDGVLVPRAVGFVSLSTYACNRIHKRFTVKQHNSITNLQAVGKATSIGNIGMQTVLAGATFALDRRTPAIEAIFSKVGNFTGGVLGEQIAS